MIGNSSVYGSSVGVCHIISGASSSSCMISLGIVVVPVESGICGMVTSSGAPVELESSISISISS